MFEICLKQPEAKTSWTPLLETPPYLRFFSEASDGLDGRQLTVQTHQMLTKKA